MSIKRTAKAIYPKERLGASAYREQRYVREAERLVGLGSGKRKHEPSEVALEEVADSLPTMGLGSLQIQESQETSSHKADTLLTDPTKAIAGKLCK